MIDGGIRVEQARLATGGRLGRYEILEHVASGGMAEVYLCRRSGIGGFQRQVILKVVRAAFAEEAEYVRMFLDEARIAGAVNHPNIAAVYEAEETDGVAFLVMEYVAGPTMSRLVKFSERLERTNRLAMASLIAGAARGLHHVHNSTAGTGRTAGLIHRDVSLDNILASRDGIAKVVDFGIALAAERLSKTEGDLVKGKLAYVSPEQLSGDGVDYRADLYSLGVCLYRATVGVPPFADVNPHALLKARLTNVFKTPSELEPSFPEELERIILKSMAVEPTERHASAGQFANELESWIRSVQPSFDTTDVAAWLATCFQSEADWRSRPLGQSAPSPSNASGVSSLGKASAVPEVGEITAIRPALDGEPTSITAAPRPSNGAPWALTAASATLVGLGILALINAAMHTNTAAPPIDFGVTKVLATPQITPAPDVATDEAPPRPGASPISPTTGAAPTNAVPTSATPGARPRAAAMPPATTAVTTTPPLPPTAAPEISTRTLTRTEAGTAVARSLEADGWTITARDWKGSGASIDLVATKGGAVRVVDVKVVNATTLDADVPQNRRRLRLASDAWLAVNPGPASVSLSVAAVAPTPTGTQVRWIPLAP